RLVDEGRSARVAVGDDVEGDGARRPDGLARTRTADRADASIARAWRGNGLADRRRPDLRNGTAPRRTGAATARARGDGADLKEQAAGEGDRAGAAAYARDVE